MEINFFKYHGTGNDFIMIDNRSKQFIPHPGTVAGLCHRQFGIGSDGLILIEAHPEADFLMRYFNSDGHEATFCGNGARCSVAFASKLGMAAAQVRFVAADGIHHASIIQSSPKKTKVLLDMQDVLLPVKHHEGLWMDTGSPHLVIFTQNISPVNINDEGQKLRQLKKWGVKGVNVNFAEMVYGDIFLRTYERGVERETLSCGTGAVAVALAAFSEKLIEKSPAIIKTQGGELNVYFNADKSGFNGVKLEGEAVFVFSGNIRLSK
jgi:diaminopimelate epimerase